MDEDRIRAIANKVADAKIAAHEIRFTVFGLLTLVLWLVAR